MNGHVLIKQVKSLSFRGHMSFMYSTTWVRCTVLCTAAFLHLWKKDVTTKTAELAPGGIIPVPQIYMLFFWAGLEHSAEQIWMLGDRAQSIQGKPAQPTAAWAAPKSHLSPRKGTAIILAEQQEPAASPKAAGCLQSTGEHATARLRTQDRASSNKGVPSLTANFRTDKVRKENKRRNRILEKWKHLSKDLLKAIPHLLKASPETQLHSSWQSLQVTPNYPAEQDDSAIAVRQSAHVTMESNSQTEYFSGSTCGNPDKIEELSWQGMVFSHILPEGLDFLSHPTLLA